MLFRECRPDPLHISYNVDLSYTVVQSSLSNMVFSVQWEGHGNLHSVGASINIRLITFIILMTHKLLPCCSQLIFQIKGKQAWSIRTGRLIQLFIKNGLSIKHCIWRAYCTSQFSFHSAPVLTIEYSSMKHSAPRQETQKGMKSSDFPACSQCFCDS